MTPSTKKPNNLVVFGIYRDRLSLENAVSALRANGFRYADVSVLMADHETTRQFATEKQTKAPEGAAAGAGTGVVLGGAFGWLVGIGALAIPGVGPLIAAGPIMAALAGAGIGGALGGLTGGLVGMGIPEYEAKRYAGYVTDGGMLLSVHADDKQWAKKAKDLLESTGAKDISSTREAKPELKPEDTSSALPPVGLRGDYRQAQSDRDRDADLGRTGII